jgi:predicted lipoprotein with Yx(FWY)xxD motif
MKNGGEGLKDLAHKKFPSPPIDADSASHGGDGGRGEGEGGGAVHADGAFAIGHIVCLALGLVAGAAAAAEPTWFPPEVAGRVTGAGTFLTDAKGMALYTYERDVVPGKSACVDDCAKAWPPLAASAEAKPQGEWSLIAREDGIVQWAFKTKPLYTYVRDSYPGGMLGDFVGNAWRVAFLPIALPPGVAVRALGVGRTLVDGRGMTVYARGDDTPAKSACDRVCLETWTPLPAPLMANAVGDFAPLAMADGNRQWAYKGERLYTYSGDIKPGDMRGTASGATWKVMVLDPTPPLPAWVTLQNSDMGTIYADAKGMTLYTLASDLEKMMQVTCNAACVKANWRTVPAAPDATPSGDWTVIARGEERLWAYRGNILYTHMRDKEPGGIAGDKWAAGAGGGGGWQPIVYRRDYEE